MDLILTNYAAYLSPIDAIVTSLDITSCKYNGIIEYDWNYEASGNKIMKTELDKNWTLDEIEMERVGENSEQSAVVDKCPGIPDAMKALIFYRSQMV